MCMIRKKAHRAVLRLLPEEIEEAEALLARDTRVEDAGPDEVLMSWAVPVVGDPQGRQADVKIVNGSNGPWSEVVLFDEHGVEITCSNVDERVMGEWPFFAEDDEDHLVVHVIEGGTGCIEGLACPACFQADAFNIAIDTWGRCDSEGVEMEGDSEWNDSSACTCRQCHFDGTVADFRNAELPAAAEPGSAPTT